MDSKHRSASAFILTCASPSPRGEPGQLPEANAPFTDEALAPILERLTPRGLRPVKLSELLASVP